MKKKVIVALFLGIVFSLYSAQIYFQLGSSQLTDESISSLENFKDEFQTVIKENPNSTIIITGYTDNIGSSSKNKILSKQRAEIVKQFIIDELKMNPKYIELFGRGSDNPIASNNIADGRAKNRRVEIKFEDPEARIGWLQNMVKYTANRSGEIQSAKKNDELYQFDKINTEKNSRSGIRFFDSNMVILEENSLMIIFGDINQDNADLLENKFHIELKYGKLYNKLQNLKDKSMNIKTPAADLELYSAKNDVEFSDNQTKAAIYEGYGLVFAQGKSIKVDEGFGVTIETGKEPETPVKLPAVPTGLQIEKRDPSISGERVFLSWTGETDQYLIQISSNPLFEKISTRQEINTNKFETNLGYGNYYINLRSIDTNGMKSEYSQTLEVSVNEEEPFSITNLKTDSINKSSSDKFSINGSTQENIRIMINKILVTKSESNTFLHEIKLVEGLNTITISALFPNNTQKDYNYKILYEAKINKEISINGLDETEATISEEEIYGLSGQIHKNTKLYINGIEVTNQAGEFNYDLKLEKGANNIKIKAIFADETEIEYNYTIIYKVESKSKLSETLLIILIASILFAVPIIINQ